MLFLVRSMLMIVPHSCSAFIIFRYNLNVFYSLVCLDNFFCCNCFVSFAESYFCYSSMGGFNWGHNGLPCQSILSNVKQPFIVLNLSLSLCACACVRVSCPRHFPGTSSELLHPWRIHCWGPEEVQCWLIWKHETFNNNKLKQNTTRGAQWGRGFMALGAGFQGSAG